ncbi:hypothetical protein [Cupriavidus sp. DL-D2]|uniref:hypothetical protein n=1 Tax=Cupriavidus sp. DL-D2 TaxID=3144974 RepID=UPI00321599E2
MPFPNPHPECGEIKDRKVTTVGTFQLVQLRYEACVIEQLLVLEHGSWHTIRFRQGEHFVWSLT